MTADVSSAAKAEAKRAVDAAFGDLVTLSNTLHADPEVAWQEHRSSAAVGDALKKLGFAVTRDYLGFDTAFLATFGSGPVRIGIMAEYDALPGLGHACGHNIIAASAVGAAAGLAAVAGQAGLTIEVYGTPAEEGGGGKIEMLDRGAFQNLDLAMMVHPAPVNIAEARPFAVSHSHVRYTGKAAHAGAYPERGINANDAFIVAQVALGLLRQQLPAGVRVHGVMTNGGEAPNAIPEVTEGRWYVRAESLAQLVEIEARVLACFEAGALATGCTLEFTPESQPYAEFTTAEGALAHFKRNATELGRDFTPTEGDSAMNRASTDMGNVSRIAPSIHPYLSIGSLPASNHQKAFADACVGALAESAIYDGSVAMAWTALDVARESQLR